MFPTGIVIHLVLGVTLIPVFSSSIVSNVPLTLVQRDIKVSKDVSRTGSSKSINITDNPDSSSDHRSLANAKKADMWTKLEIYHQKKPAEGPNEESHKSDLSKIQRKDDFNVSKTSYSIVGDERNPFFMLLKATNLNRNSIAKEDTKHMRVWYNNYAYPDSGRVDSEISLNREAYLDSETKLEHKIIQPHRQHIDSPTANTNEVSIWRRKDDKIRRIKRDEDEKAPVPEYCKPFSEPQPDRTNKSFYTFFSPGFPGNYPNNSDCMTVISADHSGQLIKLDFRNYFDMEESQDCAFDYLEIRDGSQGYSTLLGKYCGKGFPPIITSQGRYLWLRFRSDDNIEYRGFNAVYELVGKPATSNQPEMEPCEFELSGSEGFINKTDIPQATIDYAVKYGEPLDCIWIITVDPGKKIQLNFETFSLKMPNDCDSNFVDVFPETTIMSARLKNFCGSMADIVESKDNILRIRYFTLPAAINSSFSANFTAYREKKSEQKCNADEYDCEDNTCIDPKLRCNERYNCKLKWDEEQCDKQSGSVLLQSDHIVIILVVFSLILFGMSVAFVFNCIKKLINDHRIIQEHIRQSREGNLDSTGQMTTKIVEPVSKIALKQDGLSPSSRTGSGQLDNTNCYVPGVGEILPILLKNDMRERANKITHHNASINNRDNEIIMRQQSIHRNEREPSIEQDKESESDDQGAMEQPAPEMCDSCCQTRESLFQTSPFRQQSSSDRSFSPVAPSIDYSRKPVRDREMHSSDSSVRPFHQQSSTPFSTFGYSGSTVQRQDSRQSSRAKDPKYKAEAVIEMEHYSEDNGNFDDPNKNISRSTDTYKLEDQVNRNRIHVEDQSKIPKSTGRGLDKHYMDQSKRHYERRPYSVETTKSAPDVIIMTKSH